MGRDKAEVHVGRLTMLQRVAAAASPVASRLVLLGPDREGWESWPDEVHVGGPLAGLVTALGRTTSDRVLLLAVDQPFLRTETLRRLVAIESELPVVPVDETGQRQVTCAIYPTSILDSARSEAASDGSVQSLLDRVSFQPVTAAEWSTWGEDGRSWFSVDDPADLEKGIEEFTEGSS